MVESVKYNSVNERVSYVIFHWEIKSTHTEKQYAVLKKCISNQQNIKHIITLIMKW